MLALAFRSKSLNRFYSFLCARQWPAGSVSGKLATSTKLDSAATPHPRESKPTPPTPIPPPPPGTACAPPPWLSLLLRLVLVRLGGGVHSGSTLVSGECEGRCRVLIPPIDTPCAPWRGAPPSAPPALVLSPPAGPVPSDGRPAAGSAACGGKWAAEEGCRCAEAERGGEGWRGGVWW